MERVGRVTRIQKMIGGFFLALALAGASGVTVHNVTALRHTERAVIQVQETVSEQDRRADKIEGQLAKLEALEEYEHAHGGPAGACLCVDDRLPGTEYQHLVCSLAPDCDHRAMKACEALHPGFICKPLLEYGGEEKDGGGSTNY